MMTTNRTVVVGAVALSAVIALLNAGGALGAAVNSAGETWVEAPDRTPVSLVVNGTSLTINIKPFDTQNNVPRSALVLVDQGRADSPFFGDLIAAGARGFSFDLSSTGSAMAERFVFIHGASGREWRCNVTVPASGTVTNTLLLDYVSWDYAENGYVSLAKRKPYTDWVADLKSVAEVGVKLTPGGAPSATLAQVYTVSQFQLFDDNGVIGVPATLTAGQRGELLNRFGVLSFENVPDKTVDTDKDLVSDATEIMVGTAWNDASDRFESKIASASAGVSLRWRCNAGIYNVLRADGDINSGFVKISIDGSEAVAPTASEETAGYMERVDVGATGQGPYFYRVERIGNK